jgi:hydroxyacylglutathione hydrolase
MPLDVHIIECLEDNYAYLLRCANSGRTVIIDTPDPGKILEEAGKIGWDIDEIWNTHHHWDHAGGNDKIREATGAKVVAAASEADKIGHVDRMVSHGDYLRVGENEAEVLDVGGHTSGHVAFYFGGADTVFTGDTLFNLGCGRMFEGDPEQFLTSLQRLKHLPGATSVYCGHEYTVKNGEFALTVDPDNTLLQAYVQMAKEKRARNEPTVPSTIRAERGANPFLRWDDPVLRSRLNMDEARDAEVFAELRRRKDAF